MKYTVRTTGSDVSSPDLASMLTSYVTGKYVVQIENTTKESVEFGLIGKSLLASQEKKKQQDDYFSAMLTPTKKSAPVVISLGAGESKSVEIDDANLFGVVAKYDKDAWAICSKRSLDASKVATVQVEASDLADKIQEDDKRLLGLLDLKPPVAAAVEQQPVVVGRTKEKRCCC